MDWDSRVLSVLGSEGYASIMWSCDESDYLSGRAVSQAVNIFLGWLGRGALIFMHPDSRPTPAAVVELIRHVRARGYRFVNFHDALFPLDLSDRVIPMSISAAPTGTRLR